MYGSTSLVKKHAKSVNHASYLTYFLHMPWDKLHIFSLIPSTKGLLGLMYSWASITTALPKGVLILMHLHLVVYHQTKTSPHSAIFPQKLHGFDSWV